MTFYFNPSTLILWAFLTIVIQGVRTANLGNLLDNLGHQGDSVIEENVLNLSSRASRSEFDAEDSIRSHENARQILGQNDIGPPRAASPDTGQILNSVISKEINFDNAVSRKISLMKINYAAISVKLKRFKGLLNEKPVETEDYWLKKINDLIHFHKTTVEELSQKQIAWLSGDPGEIGYLVRQARKPISRSQTLPPTRRVVKTSLENFSPDDMFQLRQGKGDSKKRFKLMSSPSTFDHTDSTSAEDLSEILSREPSFNEGRIPLHDSMFSIPVFRRSILGARRQLKELTNLFSAEVFAPVHEGKWMGNTEPINLQQISQEALSFRKLILQIVDYMYRYNLINRMDLKYFFSQNNNLKIASLNAIPDFEKWSDSDDHKIPITETWKGNCFESHYNAIFNALPKTDQAEFMYNVLKRMYRYRNWVAEEYHSESYFLSGRFFSDDTFFGTLQSYLKLSTDPDSKMKTTRELDGEKMKFRSQNPTFAQLRKFLEKIIEIFENPPLDWTVPLEGENPKQAQLDIIFEILAFIQTNYGPEIIQDIEKQNNEIFQKKFELYYSTAQLNQYVAGIKDFIDGKYDGALLSKEEVYAHWKKIEILNEWKMKLYQECSQHNPKSQEYLEFEIDLQKDPQTLRELKKRLDLFCGESTFFL